MKVDTSELQKFQSRFEKKYQAQVGVIGDKSQRNDSGGLSNADILLIHEYGSITRNIPRRSVFESLNIKRKELADKIKKIVASDIKNKKPIYDTYFKIALEMLDICREAFFTNGYGTWEPLKPETIDRKVNQVSKEYQSVAKIYTLIDKGFLLQSFTFRVKRII
jgi:hypothetical protein